VSARRLRVGVVAHEYPPHVGGVETVAHALAARLAERHDVVVLTSAHGDAGGRPGVERAAGLEVHRVPAVRPPERAGVPYPVPAGPGLRAALRALAGADVLHAHGALYPHTALAAAVAARTGAPLVLTEHVGLVPYASAALGALQRAAWRVVGDRVLARTARAAALNARVAGWVAARRPGLPVARVANGVCGRTFRPASPDERAAARARFGLPADAPVVLLAARRAEKKNVGAVVAAARAALAGDALLVTCGADHGGADEGVRHLGAVAHAEMPALFAAADVLAHAGVGEGFPVAVQEAMAAGVPVALLWDDAYAPEVARDAVAAVAALGAMGPGAPRALRRPGAPPRARRARPPRGARAVELGRRRVGLRGPVRRRAGRPRRPARPPRPRPRPRDRRMRVATDPAAHAAAYAEVRRGKESRHAPADRLRPSRLQYDWLLLDALARDVAALIGRLPPGGVVLDVGCGRSPYAEPLAAAGQAVCTLDVTPDTRPDYVGTAERTGLADASVDAVLCTQVLEHCDDPWAAAREFARVLRPGGRVIASAPHVWFYHPHPSDNWRFTQDGLVRLMAGAGLEVEEVRAQGGTIAAAAQVANFLAYGALGRRGAPLYAVVNAAAAALDRRVPNALFSLNFACIARRPH
jgi:glycosyltransferase involved in cell wall biosynthesis/2-polyprenyl-3-methyl-5-hydroxy-6-metoxy-1,4-benzoquinol methylase